MKTFKNKKKLSGKKKHSRLINKKCTRVKGQYKKYSKLRGGARVNPFADAVPILGTKAAGLSNLEPTILKKSVNLSEVETRIKDKYFCETFNKQKGENNNFYNIYDCTPEQPFYNIKNKIKIYVDKTNNNKQFAIHEYSNQSFTIEYSDGIVKKSFNLGLIDLNVDIMQVALNNGCLSSEESSTVSTSEYATLNFP
jgi:hypothetical protein